tara:strand:+ start:45 stop:1250 length:1206 start_codon:yes stop_codon:yes gene_type:complete
MKKKRKDMKKKNTLLIMWPYKFTATDAQQFEIAQIEKKGVKVIINDLSYITNKYYDAVITKGFNKVKKFKSINQWSVYLTKLKKNHNIFLYNHIAFNSFNALKLHYLVNTSKLPFLTYPSPLVAPTLTEKNKDYWYFKIKGIHNYLGNIILLFKQKLISFCESKINYKKKYILLAGNFRYSKKKENGKIINGHALDYSQFLQIKKKLKKNYIVYLDGQEPYFKSDWDFTKQQEYYHKFNIPKWYKDYNNFFDFLEKEFSCKVIICSHPKTKGHDNPYYKKRIIDHRTNAASSLIPSAKFVVTEHSSAVSYAVLARKPIIFITNDQLNSLPVLNDEISSVAAETGSKVINVNSFKKKNFLENLKINKKIYVNYKYKYLVSKSNENKKNYEIIVNLINNYYKK